METKNILEDLMKNMFKFQKKHKLGNSDLICMCAGFPIFLQDFIARCNIDNYGKNTNNN